MTLLPTFASKITYVDAKTQLAMKESVDLFVSTLIGTLAVITILDYSVK